MNPTGRLLLLLFILLKGIQLNGTHLMGGEITWACLGNGNYAFTMKIYRDCNGIPFITDGIQLRVHNHPNIQFIPLSLVSQTDISPQCNGSGPTYNCGNPAAGSVQEFILRSSVINLPGTPPPQGWVFTYSGCCRNVTAISNLQIVPTTGFTLRAIMYPYNGSIVSPCFDSSPVFAQRPTTVICIHNPFTYNHNAFDVDKDSLAYEFASPLDLLPEDEAFTASNPPAINWQPGYSVDSPFPGPALLNSVPATLNPYSGEISFTPNWTGNFVTAIKVSAYRCGSLVAEIFREIQVVIISCGENNPPTITAPFVNTQTGLQTLFTDTVQAGDLASFSITATDNEYLPIGVAQSISVNASGGQFGTNFTDPANGCTNPPCATLSPAPPVILPNNGTITFNWQTTCDHIAIMDDCYSPMSTHTFVLSFQDDFCPAPSYHIATIAIVVTAPPLVPSPSLRCLSVLPGGDVQLDWIPPPLPPGTEFNSYHIFTGSSQNGPFTLIDSIFDITETSYVHSGAGAESGSQWYYIRTRSGCDSRIFSQALDTLQTIYLNVSDAGSGQIDLAWNPLCQPLLPSTLLPYQVYRQYPPAGMLAFTTTPALTAEDFMVGCLQDIFYNVRIQDQSGCTSVSNVDGGPFTNDESPAPPVIDSVSVNYTDNSVYIGWNSSTSADTRAYIIYQVINGVAVLVDTVFDQFATSYLFTGGDPDEGSLSFLVTALDECDLESSKPPEHSTIHLVYDLQSCENRIDLNWNPYNSWPSAPDHYFVFISQDGSAYVNTATTSSGSFTLTGLQPSSSYCFIVQAFDVNGNASSTSNQICFIANVQDLPQFAYLRKATVLQNGNTFSTCVIDTASDIAFYKILRSDFPGNYFDTLVTAAIPGGVNTVNFIDAQALTASQSYTYVYVLVDKCDNESRVSNQGRTILLQGKGDDGFINRLQWNTYGDWDAGVEKYQLYRSIDGGLTFNYLAETGTDTSFTDRVVDEVDTNLVFCYLVEAIENSGNQYGYRDTSWSNKLCVTQKPTIYIPNTFIPQSPFSNNIFKAVGLYENLAVDHEFIIFNRWGEQLFYTADTHKGWDGKYMSAYVPGGIYVYRIRFSYPDGSTYDQKGAILVLE